MTDKNIKMVALDLDGTTLSSNGTITERTVSAFEKAMERGVHIIISTGRTFQSLPKQLFSIDGLEYVVTSNGAHITRLADRKLIYEDHIPASGVETVVRLLRGRDISVETFVGGKAYIGQGEYDDVLANGSTYRDAEYIRKTRQPVPDIFDFLLDHRDAVENININFEFLEEKERWRKTLEAIEGTTLTSSFIHNFEVGGSCTSKAAALRYLMEMVGVIPEELMACGDSPNDAEMLKLAGIGVAVANATEDTKAVADYITDTNGNDGVAKAIEKFVLK